MNAPNQNEQIEHFLTVMRAACVQRPSGPAVLAYERWKSAFVRDFPGVTPETYTWVVTEIGKACGI